MKRILKRREKKLYALLPKLSLWLQTTFFQKKEKKKKKKNWHLSNLLTPKPRNKSGANLVLSTRSSFLYSQKQLTSRVVLQNQEAHLHSLEPNLVCKRACYYCFGSIVTLIISLSIERYWIKKKKSDPKKKKSEGRWLREVQILECRFFLCPIVLLFLRKEDVRFGGFVKCEMKGKTKKK